MGEPQRSPTAESYSIFGIPKNASIKDMCKSYKSLFYMKWNSDKSPSKSDKEAEAEAKYEAKFQAYKARNGKKQDEKQTNPDEPSTPLSDRRSVDDGFFVRPSFFTKSASRRSHTPSPRPTYLSKSASKRSNTPPKSPLSFLSRSRSKRPTSEIESPSTSRRGSPNSSRRGSPSSSRKGSPNSSRRGSPSSRKSSPNSSKRGAVEMESPRNTSEMESPRIARSMSRRNTIIYSQTSARRKPPPVEKKLECTLEELCYGGVKKIMIKRDVINGEGLFVQEESILKINLKPGWKKGTKITFEGKGDERPGFLPADIIFSIEEKRHHLFRREGDDLQIGVEVPLIQSLTGCSISVPLLGGEKMKLSFEEIIYPGFQKVIKGQGMPNPKNKGQRGDLRIEFLVNFPLDLGDEQRSQVFDILKDCSY